MSSISSRTAHSATVVSKPYFQSSHTSLHSRDETETTAVSGADDDEYWEDLEEEEHFDEIEKELIAFTKRRVRRTVSADDTLHQMRRGRGSRVTSDAAGKHLRRAVTLDDGAKSAQMVLDRITKANATNGYFQEPASTVAAEATEEDASQSLRPVRFLEDTLHGVSAKTFDSKTWEPYFTLVTEERIAAHNIDVARAIRRNDVDTLRQLYQGQQGETGIATTTSATPLDGCNSHGESMMHLACRLGNSQVVKFLIGEAGVSVKVRDDQGKTPLHDVCWSNKPNFELVRFIVNHSPELLFIADFRDFTALHYIPTACWQEWRDWIESNATWLLEKVKDSAWLKVQNDVDAAQLRMKRLLAKAAIALEEP